MRTKPKFRLVTNHVWCSLIITTLVCVSSGASAQDSPDNEDDGTVIGTVVVKVAEPAADSSFLRGARKLDKIKWALTFAKAEGFTFANRYVKVVSGSEEHFVLKLKGGAYRFEQLVAQRFANFYFETPVRFEVTPRTTTYIGRLEITVPHRMNEGPRILKVVDSQVETVEALKKENPELAADVRKSLMSIEE